MVHVTVLGAGPAGVAAAYALTRSERARVSVFERSDRVGGNAGSFRLDGIWCDYGSHRFHPVADPRVLSDVKQLVGDDLLLRPRHGRIRLQERWIHFPLKPADLLLQLPLNFAGSIGLDIARRLWPQPTPTEENFATVLHRGLGRTMSENFYYPYVEKLWGLPPEQLAVTLAKRRVSGNSIGKILQKITNQLPGRKSETTGRFFYPREGFGQISERLRQAAQERGAEFAFNTRVTGISREGNKVAAVHIERNGENERHTTDIVWSTLPISLLVRFMTPPPPQPVIEAAQRIKFRGMILIYLVLAQGQFTEYDAHYFPERSIPISRMSEPKNYSAANGPKDITILCAELPSDSGDAQWALSDDELGSYMCKWLDSVGLPVKAKVIKTVTRRLAQAYPVYDRNYETHFKAMDEWLASIHGLLTFGRQGLFAHDNTHHAMAMAYAAADCLCADGSFDRARWNDYRVEFASHVVED